MLGSRGAASRGCWASGGSDRSPWRRPRRDVRRLRRSHRARIGRRRRQRCPRWPFRGRIDDPARPICCSRLTSQRARFPGKIDRAAGCAGRRMDSDEWHDYRPTLRRMRTSRVATVSAAPAKPVRSCSSFARAGGAPCCLLLCGSSGRGRVAPILSRARAGSGQSRFGCAMPPRHQRLTDGFCLRLAGLAAATRGVRVQRRSGGRSSPKIGLEADDAAASRRDDLLSSEVRTGGPVVAAGPQPVLSRRFHRA